jgi:hypothetical protein
MIALTGAGAAAAGDRCTGWAPERPSDVRGITWTGTVSSNQPTAPVAPNGYQPWSITFEVDRVYAGSDKVKLPYGRGLRAGEQFRVTSSNCGQPGGLGLTPGKRYLVSTRGFPGSTLKAVATAAWLLDGENATVVSMYKDRDPAQAFRTPTTLGEVLALVVVKPPPTDSSALPQPAPLELPMLVAGLAVGLWLAARLRHARQRLAAPEVRSGS